MSCCTFQRYSVIGCFLLACAIGSATILSAGPAPDTGRKTPSPVDKVRKALDETMSLEVTNQPLSVALNGIRERTGVNFVVDRLTIQQTGIDPEQMQVSVNLKDVKARSCLRSILSPHNLGYAIIGDTVLISTDDMAMHRQVRQRVNIDLEEIDFADALKQVARDTGASILLDARVAKDAHKKVTVQLDDVPLETAVRLMAETAGLKPVRVGNVLFVTSKANAVAMQNDAAATSPDNTYTGHLNGVFKDTAK